MRRVVIAGLFVLAVAGCASDGSEDSDDYGNLLDSPAGLLLVEEEHISGWTRPDCFACHEVRNMHTVNRTGIPDLDLAEIRAIVQTEGERSCVLCHGTNGVAP